MCGWKIGALGFGTRVCTTWSIKIFASQQACVHKKKVDQGGKHLKGLLTPPPFKVVLPQSENWPKQKSWAPISMQAIWKSYKFTRGWIQSVVVLSTEVVALLLLL